MSLTSVAAAGVVASCGGASGATDAAGTSPAGPEESSAASSWLPYLAAAAPVPGVPGVPLPSVPLPGVPGIDVPRTPPGPAPAPVTPDAVLVPTGTAISSAGTPAGGVPQALALVVVAAPAPPGPAGQRSPVALNLAAAIPVLRVLGTDPSPASIDGVPVTVTPVPAHDVAVGPGTDPGRGVAPAPNATAPAVPAPPATPLQVGPPPEAGRPTPLPLVGLPVG